MVLLIISDASVLIDIEHGELASFMFSLPYQFIVPDILFLEELEERHSHLLQMGLLCQTVDSCLITEAYNLRFKYPKLSVNDLLALTLASSKKCQLLTGDKALREVATKFNLEVHGTLWLVDQMIYLEKINVDIANIAFQKMKDCGARLPWEEINKRLHNYNADNSLLLENN